MSVEPAQISQHQDLDPGRCIAMLRPYVARHVLRDDIEDVLQETMLRMHQRQSVATVENMNAYAFQTVRSVLADRWRRASVRRSDAHMMLDEAHHPVDMVTPEQILLGRQTMQRLVSVLEKMPVRTRQIFMLHRFDEMSYIEIADHCGISLSAVGKHIVKALRFLAQNDLP
jgi:RNA polymerase sigma factor (sigma-70 family)